jgi:hypothetical protein
VPLLGVLSHQTQPHLPKSKLVIAAYLCTQTTGLALDLYSCPLTI